MTNFRCIEFDLSAISQNQRGGIVVNPPTHHSALIKYVLSNNQNLTQFCILHFVFCII
jgi:hypothetical protein